MINDNEWIAPTDYKIYCFHGKPAFIMACIGREDGHPLFFCFDEDWKSLKITKDIIDHPNVVVKKPKCLHELFNYARILSKPFKFVRADFYESHGKIYFGELTFTPSAGLDADFFPNVNLELGELLVLEDLKSEEKN